MPPQQALDLVGVDAEDYIGGDVTLVPGFGLVPVEYVLDEERLESLGVSEEPVDEEIEDDSLTEEDTAEEEVEEEEEEKAKKRKFIVLPNSVDDEVFQQFCILARSQCARLLSLSNGSKLCCGTSLI